MIGLRLHCVRALRHRLRLSRKMALAARSLRCRSVLGDRRTATDPGGGRQGENEAQPPRFRKKRPAVKPDPTGDVGLRAESSPRIASGWRVRIRECSMSSAADIRKGMPTRKLEKAAFEQRFCLSSGTRRSRTLTAGFDLSPRPPGKLTRPAASRRRPDRPGLVLRIPTMNSPSTG